MSVLQYTNRRIKSPRKNQWVLSRLLLLIAWSIVFISIVSRNTFDAPDSTEHDCFTNTPSSSNTGIALREEKRREEKRREEKRREHSFSSE